MLKLHDVYCKNCDYENEILCEENDYGKCPICNKPLYKAFKSFNFELKYNPKTDKCAWASSGYEESHYWDECKKQKFETGKAANHPGSCDLPVSN